MEDKNVVMVQIVVRLDDHPCGGPVLWRQSRDQFYMLWPSILSQSLVVLLFKALETQKQTNFYGNTEE